MPTPSTLPILNQCSKNTITSPNPRRLSSRHHRRPDRSAAAAALASLLFLSIAWLSLVFSSFPLSLSPPSLHSPPPPSIQTLDSSSSSSSSSFSSSSLQSPLSLHHIVFGIAGSADLWPRRRHFLRLWWRPSHMRGHVWLDDLPSLLSSDDNNATSLSSLLPPIRVSADISRFRYTNPTGHPSGLRIARIVAESFRMAHADARWFFLCDDDTVISPDNLVDVLSKYDWREMVYVGGPSESHSANTYFSHSMAFGGGGVAISYPLAEALSGMQDECLERYPRLYGSDDRLHACISELGVPLSREYGFHQWDIRGSAHGLLAAHPIAPFVSIHHVEAVDPLFPGLSALESLKLFTTAMKTEPRSFLQRAICYDANRKLTFAVSLGYVVQVFPNIVLPRELERSERTFVAWNRNNKWDEFDFDTRDVYRSVCKKPILFFLKDVKKEGNVTLGFFMRAEERDDLKRKVICFPRSPPLPHVNKIEVLANPLSDNWHMAPRRLCCSANQTRNENLGLIVGQCRRGSLGSVSY